MRKNCGYDGYDNRTYDALKQEGYHIFVGKRFPSPTVWRYLDVLQVVARAVATAPSTEDEAWETGAEKCENAEKMGSMFLGSIVANIIDKMNDDTEKIIGVHTRFLEEVLSAEVEEA